jgi:cell filamentation protein
MEKYDYTYQDTEGYCYPETNVLRNKLGIKDEDALTVAEREITSLKLLMIHNMPIIKAYDINSLCKIHKTIFEDIYAWAGQIRKGDFLSKGNSIFCRGQYITENANKIFGNILEEKYLYGLTRSNFIERMAYYMGEVNALHPFREGNGRTTREFFRQLSLNANYILDFSQMEKKELLEADIEAFNGEYKKLIEILDKIIATK